MNIGSKCWDIVGLNLLTIVINLNAGGKIAIQILLILITFHSFLIDVNFWYSIRPGLIDSRVAFGSTKVPFVVFCFFNQRLNSKHHIFYFYRVSTI